MNLQFTVRCWFRSHGGQVYQRESAARAALGPGQRRTAALGPGPPSGPGSGGPAGKRRPGPPSCRLPCCIPGVRHRARGGRTGRRERAARIFHLTKGGRGLVEQRRFCTMYTWEIVSTCSRPASVGVEVNVEKM